MIRKKDYSLPYLTRVSLGFSPINSSSSIPKNPFKYVNNCRNSNAVGKVGVSAFRPRRLCFSPLC